MKVSDFKKILGQLELGITDKEMNALVAKLTEEPQGELE